MSEPLAYFLTWTTHGTWLHGDERGSVERGTPGVQKGDARRENDAHQRLSSPPVTLNVAQRALVDATIRDHCKIRGWQIHAVNVRTQHVHVVVTASNVTPEIVMNQLKAWCSRRLNEHAGGGPQVWWTRHGSTRYVNDDPHLEEATDYVLNRQ